MNEFEQEFVCSGGNSVPVTQAPEITGEGCQKVVFFFGWTFNVQPSTRFKVAKYHIRWKTQRGASIMLNMRQGSTALNYWRWKWVVWSWSFEPGDRLERLGYELLLFKRSVKRWREWEDSRKDGVDYQIICKSGKIESALIILSISEYETTRLSFELHLLPFTTFWQCPLSSISSSKSVHLLSLSHYCFSLFHRATSPLSPLATLTTLSH